jgi:hypothetical protein
MSAAAGGGIIVRRLALVTVPLILLVSLLLPTGCGSSALLTGVALSTGEITPNGDGMGDSASIFYQLTRRASVNLYLEGQPGRFYLRKDQMRTSGNYEIRFDGAVATDGKSQVTQQVLPNGSYDVVVEARPEKGAKVEVVRTRLEVSEADTVAPQIDKVLIDPDPITPNGDADDDDTYVSFYLTKKSWVSVQVLDPSGRVTVVKPEDKTEQGPLSVKWDGSSEGMVVPDGTYNCVINARDSAGNISRTNTPVQVTQGGIPVGRIVDVEFSPTALPLGGRMKVEMTVRNVGNAPMKSLGPDPETVYTTDQSYNSIKLDEQNKPLYFERSGVWRVGIDWDGNSFGRPYPIRWGLGEDLQPGEEVTVVGYVEILQTTPKIKFWAGLVQEGVGYPQDKVGTTEISVGY